MQLIVIKFFISETFNLQYNSPIKANTIISNIWTDPDTVTTWQVKDDGIGKINFYKNGILFGGSIGQVDYVTGVVDISSAIFYTQPNAQEITIDAEPTVTDIIMDTKNIMLLGSNDIDVVKLV